MERKVTEAEEDGEEGDRPGRRLLPFPPRVPPVPYFPIGAVSLSPLASPPPAHPCKAKHPELPPSLGLWGQQAAPPGRALGRDCSPCSRWVCSRENELGAADVKEIMGSFLGTHTCVRTRSHAGLWGAERARASRPVFSGCRGDAVGFVPGPCSTARAARGNGPCTEPWDGFCSAEGRVELRQGSGPHLVFSPCLGFPSSTAGPGRAQSARRSGRGRLKGLRLHRARPRASSWSTALWFPCSSHHTGSWQGETAPNFPRSSAREVQEPALALTAAPSGISRRGFAFPLFPPSAAFKSFVSAW